MSASVFKKGSIEMLPLLMLQEKDIYGYQLIQLLAERSGGKFTVQEGSLYPLLYRMVDSGYISGRDVTVETIHGRKRNRVLYHLEPSGRIRLRELKAVFDQIQEGIQNIIKNSVPIGYGEVSTCQQSDKNLSPAGTEDPVLFQFPKGGVPVPAGG